jgi:predicted DNA-binding transcriptional regulator AlpA
MAEELVGLSEIAKLHQVARNSAWRWSRRPGFPEPVARLATGPIWRRAEIEAWASKHLPLQSGRPRKRGG